ncbi:MAG: tryptophan synthase subunit alpha [Candidatus Margulisbacteria bacterium]|nr:tryptophan synthase subunit alpha [Candidatus Margulisiibacteriota bacterium]MBU1021708.1 tryptophan synthase subunit alpha [Candidatus Margulisiibacteriota bacterium]MBU1729454.1 tryptophan synthase subunit alpha [Candidatus Margulisiibacteriota bacterium]MBU1955445.1 tryptophan synthase subunit alpha [Candidatus Margulisiibacteriota bacterium]
MEFPKRKALIPYITAGDPDLATTEKLIYELEKAGADVIELGIPFSDPLADGPVIQESHFRALKKKTSLADVFRLVAKVRRKSKIPIIFMLSVNLVYKYGVNKFIERAGEDGVHGVVIPDLPPEEEASEKFKILKESDLDTILLVAPNTPEERVEKICEQSSGFIYLVSLTGVTGVRKALSDTISASVKKIKKHTGLPVYVGFGISTPAQAKQAATVSDGVIVGSAIVKILAEEKSKSAAVSKVAKFVKSLRKAIDAA